MVHHLYNLKQVLPVIYSGMAELVDAMIWKRYAKVTKGVYHTGSSPVTTANPIQRV